jgi:cell division protein ZapA
MAQVSVTIAGKVYRMACGDGEEPHLITLGQLYDAKIDELRGSFGEIGDMRLHVMAAIMVADELSEAKTKIALLEAKIAAIKGDAGSADTRSEEIEARASGVILAAAERIERVARSLGPGTASAALSE